MPETNINNDGSGRRPGLNLSAIIVIVLTNVFTFSGSLFSFKSSQDNTQNDLMRTALEQVQIQSREIIELRALLLTAQIRIIDLEAKVRIDVNEKELMAEFLDSLPFPAWIKRYREEDGEFVMTLLNDEYTAAYGYTSDFYIGKTDSDVHDPVVAESFRKQDLFVYNNKEIVIREQTLVTKSGVVKNLFIYKFLLYMPNGDIAIGGVAIDEQVEITTEAGRTKRKLR